MPLQLEHLSVLPQELLELAREKEVWVSLLELLAS